MQLIDYHIQKDWDTTELDKKCVLIIDRKLFYDKQQLSFLDFP